MDVFYVIHRYN